MKYRNESQLRILYDLSGRRQEEIEQYQGFLEKAQPLGWEVIAISEEIEAQMRRFSETGIVDAVIGNFVSETWLNSLPADLLKVHMGMNSLGATYACVVWDMTETGRLLRKHLLDQGYESIWVFGSQGQPHLMKGLQAQGQFRTSESLREGLSDLRNAAVVCPSDYGARRALQVCRRLGKKVPEDIGVAGIGGRSLDAVLSEFSMTTVMFPYREKGRQVAEVLQGLAEGAVVSQNFLPLVRLQPGQSTLKQPNVGSSLVQPLEANLLANLQNPPPVEDWARQEGMSRRGYERAFTDQAGCTPYEFLLRLREAEAKRLLRDTTLPLYRIGEQVGIPEPSRFSAFFKNRVGVAPTVWRRGEGVG